MYSDPVKAGRKEAAHAGMNECRYPDRRRPGSRNHTLGPLALTPGSGRCGTCQYCTRHWQTAGQSAAARRSLLHPPLGIGMHPPMIKRPGSRNHTLGPLALTPGSGQRQTAGQSAAARRSLLHPPLGIGMHPPMIKRPGIGRLAGREESASGRWRSVSASPPFGPWLGNDGRVTAGYRVP
jgi:hypothetical protein